MAYKLKGDLLKYAAEHIVEARRHRTHAARVLILTDDRKSWQYLQGLLKDLYGAKYIMDDSGSDCDFSLQFDYNDPTLRDKCVEDINGAIYEYERQLEMEEEEEPETPTPTVTVTETPQPEKTDYTTYIIIGAAAIIIILLLWSPK